MITWSGGREPLWHGEDVIERLEEAVEHGWFIVVNGVKAARRLHVMAGQADPVAEDAATFTPKGHTQIVKIPEDRAQGAEESDAQHHVIYVDGDGVAVNVEYLIDNLDADIVGEATTRDAVTIGDDDTSVGAVLELEAHAAPMVM